MRHLKLLTLVLLLVLAGCSGVSNDETAGWDARQIYDKAHSALNDGDYSHALELYGKLEARYPYGRYAEQAQLETIYAHYKAEEPDAAVAAADRFIKLHPRHKEVDYAYYMRGLATFDSGEGAFSKIFKQQPSERDPQQARDAYHYFSELVKRFPSSRYAADAIKRMTFLRNSLAQYELDVANYYEKRGAWVAVANRAKYVVDNYPQTPAIPDALATMAKAYRKMGMAKLADDALQLLHKNYPDYSAE